MRTACGAHNRTFTRPSKRVFMFAWPYFSSALTEFKNSLFKRTPYVFKLSVLSFSSVELFWVKLFKK